MPVKMKSGKNYLTVVERMNMLLKEKGKEDYSLETSVQFESGVVIVKATLTLFYDGVARKYCGHALGELGKAKTLEATETHAIGRALSSAGWFGDEFASANEMEAYEKQKENKLKPIPEGTNPITGDESDIITFGKHKGKNWKEVDEDYIKWVANNSSVDWQKDKAQSVLDDRSSSEEFTQEEREAAEKKNEQVIEEKIPF